MPRKVLGFSPWPQKPTGLSREKIVQLARKRYHKKSDDDVPMKGKVAVVTGAAGGIGGELCKVIYSLGGTIVAMDRNAEGLEELQKFLLEEDRTHDSQKKNQSVRRRNNRMQTIIVNQEDLNSVSDAAEKIKSCHPKIDILVNNAGLGYPRDIVPGNPRMISAHGKDLAFTVNYLSHFLLTEKLLQRISDANGRVVHLTSTFHWKVDGSELVPPKMCTGGDKSSSSPDPIVFQSDPQMQSPKHVERSYANTKLAQLWHSRSIQAESSLSGCSSVCACPTWAATGIAGEEGRDFLQKYAFPINDCGPGVTSAINAILRTDEELGDALNDGKCFVANSRIVEYMIGIENWLASDLITQKLGWRDVLADILAGVLLVGQRYTYDEFIIQRTSPESFNNEEKRKQFYRWSKKKVEEWI